MILIIDNYDSFTYNLVQRLGEMDNSLDIKVERNDKIDVAGIASANPSHIIISPGPCTPNEAGVSVDCVKNFSGKIPILGVCLGHQSIGQAFGATIVRAKHLMHGKTDTIKHDNQFIFAGMPQPFIATRYHSLVIDPPTLSDEFVETAWATSPDGDQEIMGIRHKTLPVFGLQFHPESFLTDHGTKLLANFLNSN